MKSCKRPRMRDYYQTPSDCEEEIQRSCEFVTKVQELDDKTIFDKFVCAINSYQSKSLTYIDLKTKVASILRNHSVLFQEFYQLLSDLAVEEKNHNAAKSDLERTVEFFDKVQALGKGLHGACLNAFAFGGDIVTLIKQLNVVLRDHESLKEEFKAFLIDSRLFKEEWKEVTLSYKIRLEDEVEDESSFPDEILNERYVSMGEYDPSKVKKRRQSLQEVKLNNIEDKLFDEDRYLEGIESVVEFGKDKVRENPPPRFNEVVRRFHEDLGKKVPREFTTDPKRAIQGILRELQSEKERMSLAKRVRIREIYEHQQRKNIMNT